MSLAALHRSILPALLLATVSSHAAFDPCKFNVGIDLGQASTKSCGYMGCTTNLSDLDIPSNPDFVSKFTGHTEVGNGPITPAPESKQEGTFLAMAKSLNATPMWYTYIIAEGMKVAYNMQVGGGSDCNGGASKTVCTEWGKYFASYRSAIISQYSAFAQYAATKWGTSSPMIWAIEPDFYQYTITDHGNSQPISRQNAYSLLSDIVSAIKAAMPNAVISMDISAWAPDDWFTGMPLSLFTYMNASGGTSQPGSQIESANPLTWAHLHSITGKPIIADDGYGAGGTATSMNSNWFVSNNVQARMNDGVVGLSEAAPSASMSSTITSLHGISGSTACRVLPKYTLTLTSGTGGSVSSAPTGTSFDSGTVVKLSATTATGYTFAGWSGGVTGTKDTISVVMNGAKSVTATFSHPVPKYTLTISQLGINAIITATPTGSPYDSGTKVGLKVKPATGYKFASWSGDAAGTSTTDSTTLTMNSNKSVSATTSVVNGILDPMRIGFHMSLHGNQLVVSLVRSGSVQFSLVSISGQDVQDLGTVQMHGQEQIFGLGALATGVHFIRMRGEGWESVVQLPVLSR
jgi:uncharacterized repeat protein (TIGR02543 family)